MKKNMFVFVSSILMIIGGAISFIVAIIALASASLLIAAGFPGIYILACLLLLFSAAAELIAGIVGCANAAKPEKGKVIKVWAIIVIALYVIGEIIGLICGGSFNILNLILSLLLPVIYFIGGVQMEKVAAKEESDE